MRIVLDTNILIRANPKVKPEGLARDLLLTIAWGPHTLILSTHMLGEVRRVLSYPHVQARWPLSERAIDEYLQSLQEIAVIVTIDGPIPAVITDPDDDPILQTAIAGGAEVLAPGTTRFTMSSSSRSVRGITFAFWMTSV